MATRAGEDPPPVVLNRRAAVRPTLTGVERYTDELTRRLSGRDPRRYRVLSPRPRGREHGLGQAWEQIVLPARAAALGARLIVSTANLAPLAWPGNVLVLHDAAVLREPDAYSPAYRTWHRLAGLAAAHRARALVTVSEFSRGEIATLGGIDPARIAVVPGGVDARFTPGDPGAARTRVRAELGLAGPYVLTVATADARKQLGALAPVVAALRDRGISLAWAGDTRGYFARTPPPGGLQALGYVPDSLLPDLYRAARAFVLPSRYEGFGLTCLEAMACATPVVAADRAALPEVCGAGARLVDPDDPRALIAAVLAAAGNGPEAVRLRDAGPRQAAGFSWERTADGFAALLEAL